MKKMSFSKCHSWCSQPIYVASKCHSLVYQTLNFIVLSYREFIVWWMDITIVKIGKSGAVCKQYCHELRGPMTWNFQIWQTSWMEQWVIDVSLFLNLKRQLQTMNGFFNSDLHSLYWTYLPSFSYGLSTSFY